LFAIIPIFDAATLAFFSIAAHAIFCLFALLSYVYFFFFDAQVRRHAILRRCRRFILLFTPPYFIVCRHDTPILIAH